MESSAVGPPLKMKRHEVWRHQYRLARDLDHLDDVELSERLFDAINNIRVRSDGGKVGVRAVDQDGERWWALFTEVLEECSLRGYDYPGSINISRYQSVFDHVGDPIPDMDRAIQQNDLLRRPYLLKFGSLKWLSESFERGTFRIASAAFYDSEEHNHARRDTELRRYVRLNPRNPLWSNSPSNCRWSAIEHETDYYLMSFAEKYSSPKSGRYCSKQDDRIHPIN